MLYPGIGGISKLVDMLFHVGSGRGGGGIWKFMYNTDGPAFLERELVELGVNGYR